MICHDEFYCIVLIVVWLLLQLVTLAALFLTSSCSALMLLVRQWEGRLACKSSATTILKSLLLGIGVTWINLT